MKKDALKIIGIVVVLVLLSVLFSGCASTEVDDKNFDVEFESDDVNLIECNMEYEKNRQNKVTGVLISGVIQNKLEKRINVLITAEFYDKNGNLLGEKTFRIFGLLEKDGLRDTTSFSLEYDKENANLVDHAKLFAEEFA